MSRSRVGFDSKAGEAYVEFHDSSVYAYSGVPPSLFEEFARAESKGTFLNTMIKPRYPVRRVT
ncbi:MAG: KTSC domain-containing protein [Solirubrobacterales bacterium]